jgi:hypothetical protein
MLKMRGRFTDADVADVARLTQEAEGRCTCNLI